MFELTQQNRSKDPWLNAMLAQDRLGEESFTVWCFCHGLPTTKVGSWMPNQDMPSCQNDKCRKLQEEYWPQLFKEKGPTFWHVRRMQECEICQRERARRCIVLGCGNNDDIAETMKRFSAAAYVHPYNQPKYHAQILRAVSIAHASSETNTLVSRRRLANHS